MKNYINTNKITLISGLITAIAATAMFVMPSMAMAGGYGYGNYYGNSGNHGDYGHGSGPTYYPVHNATYYPVNSNTNVNTNTNTTVSAPTNIVINNNVSGGGTYPVYTQPIYEPVYQPVYQPVYTAPIYSQPIAYAQPSYAPTYYQDYNVAVPMNVSCSANVSFAPVGSMVLWTASVSGGNGYYTYAWSGSDQIYGSLSSADVSYNTPGQKYAAVSVYSGGQTVTVNCASIVTVGTPTYTNGNVSSAQAQAYTAPKPVVRYVTRTVVRAAAPAVSAAPAVASSTNNLAANSIFSLANIPWGWVAVLIILVLFGTVLYLLFNKHKI